MITIKNAKDLNEKEQKEFLSLYSKFFAEDCIESNKNRTLNKLKMLLLNRRFAELSILRIQRGYSTSFVCFTGLSDQTRLSGFITGYETDAGMANITHTFVDESNRNLRRIALSELYKKFAFEMKRHGMHSIQTTSDLYTPGLTNDLENLNFQQGKIRGTEIEYGKKL